MIQGSCPCRAGSEAGVGNRTVLRGINEPGRCVNITRPGP
jgi:hypothetical protein